MKLLILICVDCFIFGMAVGAWVLEWIARKGDRGRAAMMDEMKEKAEREGFHRGYASALGAISAINKPADRTKSKSMKRSF